MCLLAGCLWIDGEEHAERVESAAPPIEASLVSVDPDVWSDCGSETASFAVTVEVASAHAGTTFDVWVEVDGGERVTLPPVAATTTPVTLALEVQVATGEVSCFGLCAVPLTIGLERLGRTEELRVDVTLVADGPPEVDTVYAFDPGGGASELDSISTQDTPPGSISVADWPTVAFLLNDGYASIGEGGQAFLASCPAGTDPAQDTNTCTLLPTTVDPPVGGDWLHSVASAPLGPLGCAAALAGEDLFLYAVIEDHACGGPFSLPLNAGSPLLVDPDCDGDGVAPPSDCDDLDPAVAPGLAENWYDGIDSDCSGGSDLDQDGDGADALAYGGVDCDDEDPDRAPGVLEICDGKDNNCDDVLAVGQATLTTATGVTNFPSVQDALDAALDGDTVAVCDGEYAGAFVVNTGITFTSGSRDPARTTLTGGVLGESVVRIGNPGDALDVAVAGFTIIGAAGVSDGGGIDGRGAATLVLEDVVVEGNDAARGGGIAASDGAVLTLEDAVITGNTASISGGGLYVAGSLTVAGTGVIQGNAAEDGAGLYAEGDGTSLVVSGVTFDGNDADFDGGAIFARSTGADPIAITLDDVHLTANDAFSGGGLALRFAVLETGEVELAANTAAAGGAVHADSTTVVDLGVLGGVTSIVGNGASNWGGGVHLVDSASVLRGTDVLFDGNTAENGGAVYTGGGDVDLTGGSLTANVAVEHGGALFVGGGATAFLRGAILLDGNLAAGLDQAAYVEAGLLVACTGTQVNDPVANTNSPALSVSECFELTELDVFLDECDGC